MSLSLKYKKLIAICTVSLLTLSSCTNASPNTQTEPLSRTDFVLGTVATISLYDAQSEDLLDTAFNRIKSIEDTISVNKSNTLLDLVNEQAGLAAIEVDNDTYHLIQQGISYSQLTDGDFDITIGPLVNLWHIGFSDAKVPTEDEILEKLPLIGYELVTLDEQNQSVYLQKPNMLLDLGGIGKGYAADEVARILREGGVSKALINLGGNIMALGNKTNGSPWKIGIQNPFNPRGETVGYISVTDKSIVTSGIYERFLEQDGVRYHHILNPKTGYPFSNNIAGVTIISESSTDGDALSTSVFAKGLPDGLDFVESLEYIEGIFITTDNQIYITSGLKDNFVLTDTSFTLEN